MASPLSVVAVATCLLVACEATTGEAANSTVTVSTTATLTTSSSISTTVTTTTFTLPGHCAWGEVEPRTAWAWDTACKDGDLGCKADGIHVQCRFCGEAPYGACPTCSFELEPTSPYVWDNRCRPDRYTNGCFADGVHFECRFCGSESFDSCPTTTMTSTSATTSIKQPPTANPHGGDHHDDFLSTTRSASGRTSAEASSWGPDAMSSSGHAAWQKRWVEYLATFFIVVVTAEQALP